MAAQGAELFDTVPIAVFIYAYLFLTLHRFLRLRLLAAIALLIGFAVLTVAEGMLVPAHALNGSLPICRRLPRRLRSAGCRGHGRPGR